MIASTATALWLRPQTTRGDLGLLSVGDNLKRTRSKVTPLKQRAIQDYRQSMSVYGGSLARSGERLRATSAIDDLIDVLVIGSGYGGAVCAARLAPRLRTGYRLAVLERGKEWVPGTFPDTLPGLLKQSRYGLLGGGHQRLRNPLGLFDLTFNDEVLVLSGSGLGGGSLINAGVAAIPDADVFQQACWPTELRNLENLLPFYRVVANVLNLQSIDGDVRKTVVMREMARRTPNAWSAPALVSVAYRGQGLDMAERNAFGIQQRRCELCGDCTTGCNVGAKNILTVNYLPMARRHGAEIYTQTEVDHLEKQGDVYRVHYRQFKNVDSRATSGSVRARIVILAGGSLGSTGILLRSQSKGLDCSEQLGCHWSGNGDIYGFMVRADQETNVAGVGAYATDREPVGVTQQLHVKLESESIHRRILLQEGGVPRAFSNALGALLVDFDLDRALPFFALGHDGANGRVVLRDSRPAIVWPEYTTSGYMQFVHQRLRQLAERGNGHYRRPEMLGDKSITVHPLGGCPMGDSIDDGTANAWGQVFDASGSGSTSVHRGLYVADGSLIPTSLGANPFFTIAALAERVAQGIVGDPTWHELFEGH